MKPLTLLITPPGGTETDLSQLVKSAQWAGQYRQCARSLDLELLDGRGDAGLPAADCPLGSRVRFSQGEDLLFTGTVFSRAGSTGSHVLELGCADNGLYLKRNEDVLRAVNRTPEDIAAGLCGRFGIPVKALARTGVPITRNFIGVSLYRIIQTAYTLAGEQTGRRYLTRFSGEALEVVEKTQAGAVLVLEPGVNLLRLEDRESIEDLVNQVAVYDEDGRLIAARRNEAAFAEYGVGVLQAYLKRQTGRDPLAEAQALLDDSGMVQKLTAQCLGDTRCITGNAVAVRESVTGIYGRFWIDADTHTWKNGLYQCKLTLNFQNMMDEMSAGSTPRR